MYSMDAKERMQHELQGFCERMQCDAYILYKQDIAAGFTPVLWTSALHDIQPPYLSSASDISVSLRTSGLVSLLMQADMFRSELIRTGNADFDLTELFVFPLSVRTPGDYVLIFASELPFPANAGFIAEQAVATLTSLVRQFTRSVEDQVKVIDLHDEPQAPGFQESADLSILQVALKKESYGCLIEAIASRFAHEGDIVFEDRSGHVIASSSQNAASLKDRLCSLTYPILLNMAKGTNSPIVVSNALLQSRFDVLATDGASDGVNEDVSASSSSTLASNEGARCLIIPLTGGDEFLGLISIFDLPYDTLSNELCNGGLIAAVRFAATYLMRSHEASRSHTLQRILSSIENERRGISIDLHDETSQDLVALTVRLATAERVLEKQQYQDASQIIEDCLCIADGILTEVNRLSSELRSSELTYLDLRTAIEAEASRRFSKAGISFSLTGNALDRRFDDFQESMLLKGVTEALSNCARHARASDVVVSLDDDGSWFSIEISDNGIGFDKDAVRLNGASKSYGMKTMRDCADSLGGIFWIGAYPGGGTTVRFSIPNNLLEEAYG